MTVNPDGTFAGIVSLVTLAGWHADDNAPISTLLQPRTAAVLATDSLRTAVERMARENVDVLPVVSAGKLPQVSGVISYRDILAAYKNRLEDDSKMAPHILLKRKGLQVLLRGQALFQKQRAEA
ncbi:MAG: CBS domain-containing protein [Hymenobacter sp.]